MDIEQKKEKIIEFLKSNGPSLPVKIAKEIELSPIFASAILSELLNEKKIIASHLKIGSSPLYFLKGQERELENFIDNLNPTEREAYQKLKENKILEDKKQSPAIRVALRNLRDFAILKQENGEIIWQYAFFNEEEQKQTQPTEEVKEEVREEKEQPKEKIQEETKKEQREEIKKEEIKNKKERFKENFENIFEKESPEFLKEVKEFLTKKEIQILEEIQVDKKEIVAKIKVASKAGNIIFLLIAKNKKTLTKDEIKSALQRALYDKSPCILLVKKEPSNSIKKFIEDNSLIKIMSIEK